MTTRFSPDDPRLTAYALGELDEAERAAIEAQLRDDPAAQAAVDEIRATAAQLESALATEPLPAVQTPDSADPYRAKPGTVLRFPRIYYAVGMAAAAGFAVLVVLHHPEPKPVAEPAPVYTIQLPTAGAPAADEPTGVSNEVLDRRTVEDTAARRKAEADAQWQDMMHQSFAKEKAAEEKEMAMRGRAMRFVGSLSAPPPAAVPRQQPYERTLGEHGPAAATGGVAAQTPHPYTYTHAFGITADKDYGYLKTNSGTVTRIGMEIQGRLLPMDAVTPGTEAYAHTPETGFIRVADEPLSTFSVDVDTASYANVRRFLARGQRPPVDAVRIEELLNYFPYSYAAPADNRPFAASLEVAAAPWAPEHRLVRIGLKGREVTTAARPAANLVFLLDVSGSMSSPNKLPLVKQSLRMLVSRLRPDDRVAIVTYAGASGLALPSTPVRQAAEILKSLDDLTPAGSTNGERGIQLAYDVAKANFVTGGLNRVILCTDGDFNVGVSDEGGLVRLVEAKAKSGVFLSVLGFGMGNLKDATLEQLADKGNGNYGYIDTEREAAKVFVEQVNGTLVTIAKDVKLQIEFNPAKVAAYRLIGYENRRLQKEDFNNDQVDAGEIGAGHTVTALYEVVPAGAGEPALAPPVDEPKYQTRAAPGDSRIQIQVPRTQPEMPDMNELLTLKVRFKAPDGDASERLDFPLVDRGESFANASADFKFASAVAGFGMLLRDSALKGSTSLASVEQWAQAGIGPDAGGYRAEFLQLLHEAKPLLP